VIVTTRNEEKNIGNCLKSVLRQTYPRDRLELIVVDNQSEDRTKSIAEGYAQQVLDCGPERSAQRNLGARKASGKYVLYLDADMVLENKVVDECVSKCEIENCVGVYIPERIVGSGFWTGVRAFERTFYDASCIDAIRFVRRDKFLETGGFDESLTGPEDWDLDRRIQKVGKVGIINSRLYHNESVFDLEKYVAKKRYYSKSFSTYVQKWGREDPIARRQLGAYYRLLGVFVEGGNWRTLLRHPILTIGMYYLRLRVALNYLSVLWKGSDGGTG
jgi:glycosyltransferase involved in cell wall biosynthesis